MTTDCLCLAHRDRGFTLLELLVTLAAIALLAALLTAAVGAAKRRSAAIKCVHNLRQQGIALQTFVQDTSCYPLYGATGAERSKYPDHGVIWWRSLYPDFSFNLPPCPDARPPKNRQDSYASYGYNNGGIIGSSNDQPLGLGGRDILVGRGSPIKESEVAAPTRMIAIADGAEGWGGLARDGVGRIGRAFWVAGNASAELRGTEAAADRMRKRHPKGINVLFCDGHVDPKSYETLFANDDDESLSLWNRDGKPHRERLE